jgi:hypothetical protein
MSLRIESRLRFFAILLILRLFSELKNHKERKLVYFARSARAETPISKKAKSIFAKRNVFYEKEKKRVLYF